MCVHIVQRKEETMNQIVITVKKANVQEVIKTIEDLQEGMDILSEQSTDLELKTAYHNHGIAQGYIRCLKDLELEINPSYGRLLMKQFRIAERIKELQEKSFSKTAI